MQFQYSSFCHRKTNRKPFLCMMNSCLMSTLTRSAGMKVHLSTQWTWWIFLWQWRYKDLWRALCLKLCDLDFEKENVDYVPTVDDVASAVENKVKIDTELVAVNVVDEAHV